MSQDTNWFAGRAEEGAPRPTILPFIFWLFVILAVIGLMGCASAPVSPSPRSEVCLVQILGQTDSGVPVAALTCVTPEKFAESQK